MDKELKMIVEETMKELESEFYKDLEEGMKNPSEEVKKMWKDFDEIKTEEDRIEFYKKYIEGKI